MNKNKFKKKKGYPVSLEFPPIPMALGGDIYQNNTQGATSLAGDMGNMGKVNEGTAKDHYYFGSAMSALQGFTESIPFVGGLVASQTNQIFGSRTTDMMRNNQGYNSGKIASQPVNDLLGAFNIKSSNKQDPKTSTQQFDPTQYNGSQDLTMIDRSRDTFVTPEMTPDNTSTDVTNDLTYTGTNVWNAYGGKLGKGKRMYPNGDNIPTAQEIDDWNNLLKYYNGYIDTNKLDRKVLDSGTLSKDLWGDYAKSNPNFKYDYNEFTSRMQNYYNDLYTNPYTQKVYGIQKYGDGPVTGKDAWLGSLTSQEYIPSNLLKDEKGNIIKRDILNPYATSEKDVWNNVYSNPSIPNNISKYTTPESNSNNSTNKEMGAMALKPLLPPRYKDSNNPEPHWGVDDNKLVRFNNEYQNEPIYNIGGTQSKTFRGTGENYKVGEDTYRLDEDNTAFKIEKAMGGKMYANGGSMGLSEANGGFMHEDPNPQNINQGVPINQAATVEVGETIFNPENYVFSDRIKVPGSKQSFAQKSKAIKNKFKLRPDDKLSKNAINQGLSQLMEEQEVIKQAKAEKLMQQAVELNPALMQQMQPQEQAVDPSMMGMVPQMKMGGKFFDEGGTFKFIPPTMNGEFIEFPEDQQSVEFTNPDEVIGINKNQSPVGMSPSITNIYQSPNSDMDNTEMPWQERALSRMKAPNNYTPWKMGAYGAQALGEIARLATTQDSPTVGNAYFQRVNPYIQEAIAKQQADQTTANLTNAYRNTGISPSQYLANTTMTLGNLGSATGSNIAAIRNQADTTNANIQMKETMTNKQLEAQRNEIKAQDKANKSNQIANVGAGLVQNMSGALNDQSKREMDMFTLPLTNKENYQLVLDPKTNEYVYKYIPASQSKFKKKTK